MKKKNIMLIGFMGTGKSTISAKLREKTRMEEVDMDAAIVERENCSINEIFQNQGEAYFRQVETDVLKELLTEDHRIISCGGGAVVKEENVKMMKDNGSVILLTATAQTVFDRVKNNNDRPILRGNMNVEFIQELMKKREALYLRAADIIIETDEKSVDEICDEILIKVC